MARWGRGRPSAPRRRTGPVGEDPWWDPTDQSFAEVPVLGRSDLGKGWHAVEIPGNEERWDPYGEDPDSELIRAARGARTLTALDEGAAWRVRTAGVLAVARVEVFASDDGGAHRRAWQEHGAASLDATWRARWRERDRLPGWIEVRSGPEVAGPTTDWLTVEDQTGTAETEAVTLYEHLTVWVGRATCTFTLRHDQTDARERDAVAAVGAIERRLGLLDR